MRWGRFRNRSRNASPRAETPSAPSPTPIRGRPLLLERLDDGGGAAKILDALSERYELMSLSDDGRLFRVVVDDALGPDEAVVRLVMALDEIDRDWERRFAWPHSD